MDLSPVAPEPSVSLDALYALEPALAAAQATFDRTGGLHAAGLFDTSGRLLVLREDVGRHNAVDKVIGHMLLAGAVPLDRHILMVSGRASFEIVQKALVARIPVVAAVSAPSSLAVQRPPRDVAVFNVIEDLRTRRDVQGPRRVWLSASQALAVTASSARPAPGAALRHCQAFARRPRSTIGG
jgi:hypothetical protein